MWSATDRWFFHLDEDGRRDLRWTAQMFKLIGSGVLDGEELEGLISHLNEDEFLSAYGLHSMSKLDPAFDQEDIDNGGGGNYTAFQARAPDRTAFHHFTRSNFAPAVCPEATSLARSDHRPGGSFSAVAKETVTGRPRISTFRA